MSPAQLEKLLYGDVDGYSVSAAARDQSEAHGENYTYGEVTPTVVINMLTSANAQPHEVFYDLGSGTGKAVHYAAGLTPVRRSMGVELLPGLYKAACGVLERFCIQARPLLPEERRCCNVGFINGSMLDVDFSDADIIFTHCTCFSEDLMTGLTRKLEALKTGSRVLTVSKGIESPLFNLTHSELAEMGWGSATIYHYEHV